MSWQAAQESLCAANTPEPEFFTPYSGFLLGAAFVGQYRARRSR
jgi:hypothetical protein